MFEKRKKSLAVFLKDEHLDFLVSALLEYKLEVIFVSSESSPTSFPRIESGLDRHLILLFQFGAFSFTPIIALFMVQLL